MMKMRTVEMQPPPNFQAAAPAKIPLSGPSILNPPTNWIMSNPHTDWIMSQAPTDWLMSNVPINRMTAFCTVFEQFSEFDLMCRNTNANGN
jgi:hypothetical protein